MLRSGIILAFSHHFIVNSVHMISGTAADQLEAVGSLDSIHMPTVELTTSIPINKTGHRVFSSPFTNCHGTSPVRTAQLPHQNRIPYCLLDMAGGPCCLLCSAQALLRGMCVDWTQNSASTKNLAVYDWVRATRALTFHNLLDVTIRLLAHLSHDCCAIIINLLV